MDKHLHDYLAQTQKQCTNIQVHGFEIATLRTCYIREPALKEGLYCTI